MSGVISFRPQPTATWLVAGWVFRRVLRDTMRISPGDSQLTHALQQGEALNGLHLDLLAEENPILAEKLSDTLQRVAMLTVEDPPNTDLMWREGLDSASQSLYLDAIRDLIGIIRKEKAGQNLF